MTDNDLKDLLDREAMRINNIDFIDRDPVQFPRRFSKLQDIEIASLLSATIAWGNRKMICRDCDRMLALMDNDPYNYVMDEGYEELPDMNIHRTFFAKNMRHFLRGLRDFSFGIEGFAFSRGKVTHPVREMLITGNMTSLWNSLTAAGTDALPSSRWQIPSLAFDDVSFSA